MHVAAILIICLIFTSRSAYAEVETAFPSAIESQAALRGTLDADLTPGTTDVNGDLKQFDSALFLGAWTAQARWRMVSPQGAGLRFLHDTAIGSATLGYDGAKWIRVYLNAGYQNGPVLNDGHSAIACLHALAGFRGARRSPASTRGKAFGSMDLVAQKGFAIHSVGSVEFGLSPILWTSMGSNQAHVGGGMLAVLGFSSRVADVQINPVALAQTPIRGAYLYAGAMGRHVFHDDLYHGMEPRSAFVSLLVGGKARLGDYVAGAEMSRPLTSEARGVKRAAVSTYSASLGKNF